MEDNKSNDSTITKTSTDTENKVSNKRKLTKPTLISIVILAILLTVGVVAAAYTQVILNDPDRIWQEALNNTSSGLNEVNSIINETDVSEGSLSGSIEVLSPVPVSSMLIGEWSEDKAQITSDTNIAGTNIASELIAVNGQEDESELYLKIDGLDSLSVFSDLLIPGSNEVFNQINSNWYKLSSSDIESLSGTPELFEANKITEEDYAQDINKITKLLEEYILPEDNENNAISYVPVGREEFNGNDSYKYIININKERSQELLMEIESIIAESSVSDLENTEELESMYDIDALLDEFSSEQLEFSAWVDMDLRYFRNFRINTLNDSETDQNRIDIGLNYDGGDILPFYINANFSSEENNTTNILLSASLNRDTVELELGFIVTADVDQQSVSANGNLKFTPGENNLSVETPVEYESFDSLLESLSILNLESLNTPASQEEPIIILDDVEL